MKDIDPDFWREVDPVTGKMRPPPVLGGLIGSPEVVGYLRALREINPVQCDRIGITEAHISDCERAYAEIIRGGQGHPDAEIEQTGAVVGLVIIGLVAFGAGLLLGLVL